MKLGNCFLSFHRTLQATKNLYSQFIDADDPKNDKASAGAIDDTTRICHLYADDYGSDCRSLFGFGMVWVGLKRIKPLINSLYQSK
jgi:hypothetical protein